MIMATDVLDNPLLSSLKNLFLVQLIKSYYFCQRLLQTGAREAWHRLPQRKPCRRKVQTKARKIITINNNKT